MRRLLITAATVVGLAAGSNQANAIGCFSGAVAGAVAGHVAHHGLLGAIGGCIAGHEWRKHQVRRTDLQNRQAYVQQRQQEDPNFKDPWAQGDSQSGARSPGSSLSQPGSPMTGQPHTQTH